MASAVEFEAVFTGGPEGSAVNSSVIRGIFTAVRFRVITNITPCCRNCNNTSVDVTLVENDCAYLPKEGINADSTAAM